jgi:hypothetical protein
MIPKILPADVTVIYETDLTDPQVEVYIDVAHALITEYLADKGLSDDVLTQIEKFLTIHTIVTTLERPETLVKAGPTEVRWANIFTQGLGSTTWGQMAKVLDGTNTLSELDGIRRTPEFYAVIGMAHASARS